ncbi:MAG: hypothetical protein EOS50_20795 [Mesorhizobium sp.]|nr:MAG: hypothetical protein EOS50_20795 [Mesorhizobium sp.]TIS76302.1 MAG: hypothetical protein E5W94_18150 [Mesorhizobium sp.]TIX94106.1 MAG: hypothetical protein E5V24_10720 [Mesorhizobium sp.]TIY09426.1 MAG: hypothetical protein E5V18_01225 [Mesorhizobium sp.]
MKAANVDNIEETKPAPPLRAAEWVAAEEGTARDIRNLTSSGTPAGAWLFNSLTHGLEGGPGVADVIVAVHASSPDGLSQRHP